VSRARRGTPAVTLALGGWLAATALSQHPVRAFDGVRTAARRVGLLIPDWRFFAPEPGRWDDHVMVRTLGDDGTPTPWRSVNRYGRRRWRHAVFFPENRHEKALADAVAVLLLRLSANDREITDLLEYQLLRGYVEGHLRAERGADLPRGFQFLVLRDAGHDEGNELTMSLVSRYEPLAVERSCP
jgi:hypothetical protein